MQPLPTTKPKQPKKKVIVDSTEILKDTASEVGKTMAHEAQQAAADFWRELLGVKRHAQEMKPGVSYDLKEKPKDEKKPETSGARGSIDYAGEILRTGTGQKEHAESEQRVGMLVKELQQLAKSVQMVEKAVVMQAVGPGGKIKSGKYYESFFEWMLLVVQDARRKVENSGAWLSAMSGKSKKKQYVGKVKTSMNLLLSGERSSSNQTG